MADAGDYLTKSRVGERTQSQKRSRRGGGETYAMRPGPAPGLR